MRLGQNYLITDSISGLADEQIVQSNDKPSWLLHTATKDLEELPLNRLNLVIPGATIDVGVS